MNDRNSAGKQLLLLLLGILMCGGGLFLFSKQISVEVPYDLTVCMEDGDYLEEKGIPGGNDADSFNLRYCCMGYFSKEFCRKINHNAWYIIYYIRRNFICSA